jgi:predicted helicase
LGNRGAYSTPRPGATDKKSGIVNDANLWATETMGNPKYPLELFMRVITVSLETMKIVKSLPKLDID